MSGYSLRFLNGPQVGQVRTLASGINRLGRIPSCEIQLASNGVSKEHAKVEVTLDGKILVTDLGSRNGTYVNGMQVQNQSLKLGDKIMINGLILELIPTVASNALAVHSSAQNGQVRVAGDSVLHPTAGLPSPMGTGAGLSPIGAQDGIQPAVQLPAWIGQAVIHNPDGSRFEVGGGSASAASVSPDVDSADAAESAANKGRPKTGQPLYDLYLGFLDYIDHVAMPGIYSIVQNMTFSQGIFLFIALFVLISTAVSTVPMLNLSKSSVQFESTRRARTIARNLVALNRVAILEKNEIAINVKSAELEDGVTDALILAKDGTIMAPANRRGEFSKLPFVNQARREEKETDTVLPDGRLGVAVPVLKYNPDTGVQEPAAFAIIFYDMGSMALSGAQTLGLFIQILGIVGALGFFLFVILVRVIEHPLKDLSQQLDGALRDGRDDLATDYRFETLEGLISNINSALSRAAQAQSSMGSPMMNLVRRDVEAQNMLRIISDAAIAIDASDDKILSTNAGFNEIVGGNVDLNGRAISEIPDFSLQENLKELIPQMRSQLGQIATSQLPFSGLMYELNGQAIAGQHGEAAWYLITLIRVGGAS